MNATTPYRSSLSKTPTRLGLVALAMVLLAALHGVDTFVAAEEHSGIQSGRSYHNDVSPALRYLPPPRFPTATTDQRDLEPHEANPNPKLPLSLHVDGPDPVVDHGSPGLVAPQAMPAPIVNFDGISYPGVGCNCAPPDANGAVGLTQYVQMVNKGYQVFDKTTGASVLGPLAISSIWSGFGGVCETAGQGDPIVLYDHLANRWLISEFAGAGIPTDECIAISTTSDATGTYNRYAFHLGTNWFDAPKLGVWPDGYYMSMNVFDASGTFYLGPQAFAFDRAKMLDGLTAGVVTPGVTVAPNEFVFQPSDLDGQILPPSGTGNPFVSYPDSGTYIVRLFHADFTTPGNTTLTVVGNPAAAGFTVLCPTTKNCVPELGSGTSGKLDGMADRLMFRLAYRKFSDGHEAVVGNYTVSSGGVAGVRWFELRAVTTAPTVFQESTYQPDATWRWMGSVAMDQSGNLALGYNVSSETIHPQIRYAGRLVTDRVNALSQGEATLFSGTGSQTGSANRWGEYSSLTVDPVDDCTFWYTQEYYAATGSYNWRTRIGNFRFPSCAAPTPKPVPDGGVVAGAPMRAGRNGSGVDVSWDVSTCHSQSYNLYYGALGSFHALTGAICGLPTTGSAIGLAIPANSFWVVAGANPAVVSSFGRFPDGTEEFFTGWPALCAQAAQVTSATCP